MEFTQTRLEGVILVKPDVWKDERGFFLESYHARKYREEGIPLDFVQDNHSHSVARTLRGLHAQKEHPQGKLVRTLQGSIWDVAVDVRRGSPTFGEWVACELSDENFHQLYVPPGFVHGFCVLSDTAQVEYKCTDFYAPGDELAVLWNDPEIGIEWPISDPILSEKDAACPRLADVVDELPVYEPSPQDV